MFYVYEWFIVDTNEVFYVGKGTGNRRFETHNRNQYFKNILGKYRCAVRLVHQSLTNDEACELEKERIAELRVIGQAKCNFTSGGTGFSEGSMNPRRLNPPKGEKNPMYGVRKCGELNPFFGRRHSEETKAKISANRKGKGLDTVRITQCMARGSKERTTQCMGRMALNITIAEPTK